MICVNEEGVFHQIRSPFLEGTDDSWHPFFMDRILIDLWRSLSWKWQDMQFPKFFQKRGLLQTGHHLHLWWQRFCSQAWGQLLWGTLCKENSPYWPPYNILRHPNSLWWTFYAFNQSSIISVLAWHYRTALWLRPPNHSCMWPLHMCCRPSHICPGTHMHAQCLANATTCCQP